MVTLPLPVITPGGGKGEKGEMQEGQEGSILENRPCVVLPTFCRGQCRGR